MRLRDQLLARGMPAGHRGRVGGEAVRIHVVKRARLGIEVAMAVLAPHQHRREALARAAGSRAREVPAELASRLDTAGLSAESVMQQASTEALNAALGNVGYMLLGLIALALVLSLRLTRTRVVAVAGEAQAPAG